MGMIEKAGSGHYASSMSALEIMYPLFYEEKIKPEQFILSKGHAVPALYAILYDLGYLKDLSQFRQYGGSAMLTTSGLPGHPVLGVSGITCSSGSLGMGISKALGFAKMNPDVVYHVLVGDGELQEGQNWEALMYLMANHVTNVIVHVDCNGHQYSGEIRERWATPFYWLSKLACVKWHNTKWEYDNKYLTRAQTPAYTEKVQHYSSVLAGLMRQDAKIVVLDADLMDDFGLREIVRDFPDRFIECGISEQYMVSMANGIALAGYLPICHTYGAFYRRAIDQIYNNYHDGPKIVYTAGMVGRHPLNIGKSHEAIRGRDMLSWLPDILVTSDIQDLKHIGEKSIYLELEL